MLTGREQHVIDAARRDLTPLSKDDERRIIFNFVVVDLPVTLGIFAKVYYGLRWITLKRTRPCLVSYYLISWTIYTSFTLTKMLLLIVAWKTFT